MKYRKMPGSPERLSALGLGLMRLPTAKDGKIDEPRVWEMLQYAVDNGVNYFDTAWVYHRGESEQVLGKFVAQNDRSKFYIATKLPCWMVKQESDAADYLEKQLEKLQTDYIDYYLLHSLHDTAWKEMRRLKVPAWLEKARSDGKIRHIGFSFHDKYPVFKKIVNGFDWEFCQFMFNYLDTHYQAGLNGYRLAVEKGLGVIAMEPLRGGKLVQSIPLDIESVWKKSSHAWTPRPEGTQLGLGPSRLHGGVIRNEQFGAVAGERSPRQFSESGFARRKGTENLQPRPSGISPPHPSSLQRMRILPALSPQGGNSGGLWPLQRSGDVQPEKAAQAGIPGLDP